MYRRHPSVPVRTVPVRMRFALWIGVWLLVWAAAWTAVESRSAMAASSSQGQQMAPFPGDWQAPLWDDDDDDDRDWDDDDDDDRDDDDRYDDRDHDDRYEYRYEDRDDGRRYDDDGRSDDHRYDDSSSRDSDDAYRYRGSQSQPSSQPQVRPRRGWEDDDRAYRKAYGVVDSVQPGGRGTWVIDGITYQADAYTRFESHGMVMGVGMCAEVEYVPGNPPRAVKIEAKPAWECRGTAPRPDSREGRSERDDIRRSAGDRSGSPSAPSARPPASTSSAASGAPATAQVADPAEPAVPEIAVAEIRGPVYYRPRQGVLGIWVVGRRPFFVGQDSTVGPQVAGLRIGDRVQVIYYVDEHGLNRVIWLGSP